MAETYTLLSKTTISSTSSSITFTSIPQNYTDLVLHISARSDVSSSLAGNFLILFNGTTSGSSGYVGRRLYADPSGGSTAVAGDGTSRWSGFVIGNSSEVINNNKLKIYNYAGSQIKTWDVQTVIENNGNSGYVGFGSQRWENTAAISSFVLSNISSGANAGNFLPKSTFYLYGIAAEGVTPLNTSAPYADGGDSIYTDGTYWIHVFNSSGTFTPRKNLTCDYLVVAGGGGGGTNRGGGGGAGGLRCTVTATGGGGSLESALSLIANTNYTVTVGAGGAGGLDSTDARGSNGSNSVFSTITSTGGGGGGGNGSSQNAGASGGSGGGARESTGDPTPTGGAGTANQGYAGAAPTSNNGPSSSSGGGGGGGAGEAGNTDATYEGGDGVATSISGTSVTYAGGGGAGSNYATANGGAGGGGNGVTSNQGGNGTANLGGGGGGGGDAGATRDGGNGGSGIVIVRYAA